MKNKIIIAGSFLLLALLTVRGLYKTVTRMDDEELWYVSQLHIAGTFRVDSIALNSKGRSGLLYCNLIRGEIDDEAEFKLNKKLLHHKRIKFFTRRSDGRYLLLSQRINKYQAGDSLQINSNNNQVIFYHEGKEIVRDQMTNFLRDQIF